VNPRIRGFIDKFRVFCSVDVGLYVSVDVSEDVSEDRNKKYIKICVGAQASINILVSEKKISNLKLCR
jgi:hypothetical protein